MILRLSQKLRTKLKLGVLPATPLDANPYADWSCHLFTADRTQYILVTNTLSFYSCVLPGRGAGHDQAFIERVLSCLREFMNYDGQSFAYEKFVAPESRTVSFSKALNRSVTGSMNDMIHYAKIWLIAAGLPPLEVGLKLNEMPMSALQYLGPRMAFKSLSDVPTTNPNGGSGV